ncbi:hypothetical protein D3C76_182170 [compost metagenome]
MALSSCVRARQNRSIPWSAAPLSTALLLVISTLAKRNFRKTIRDYLFRSISGVGLVNRPLEINFGTSLTFPVHHVPDYYLGIRMNRDGTFEEIYNGPGALIQQQLAGRKPTRTGLHGGLMAMLRRINATVAEEDRIPRR